MTLFPSKNSKSNTDTAQGHFVPTSKKALIIFTKNPEPGKVKTRLARTIGNKSALEVYMFLVQHTMEVTKDLKVDKFVFYSEDIPSEDIWNSGFFQKKRQTGNDLGQRMSNAFVEIFAMEYEMAIIIGSDMFDISGEDLGAAFALLENRQYVIGPAKDGGYYLLGMKKPNPSLFQNKKWSTDTVLRQTINDLKGEDYVLLEERNDIDHYEDIEGLSEFERFLPLHLKNDI